MAALRDPCWGLGSVEDVSDMNDVRRDHREWQLANLQAFPHITCELGE
jgi:hypothetical protein